MHQTLGRGRREILQPSELVRAGGRHAPAVVALDHRLALARPEQLRAQLLPQVEAVHQLGRVPLAVHEARPAGPAQEVSVVDEPAQNRPCLRRRQRVVVGRVGGVERRVKRPPVLRRRVGVARLLAVVHVEHLRRGRGRGVNAQHHQRQLEGSLGLPTNPGCGAESIGAENQRAVQVA